MAIQCKYCGVDLPKDDARFCNKCGMLVPSHPFSPQSLSASKSESKISEPSSSNEQQERQRRVLHEQVAELSPSRSRTDRLKSDKSVRNSAELDTPQSNRLSPMSASMKETPLEKLPETPQPEPEEDEPSQVERIPEQLPGRQAGMRRRMTRPTGMLTSSPAWPAPVTHVSIKEPSEPVEDRVVEQSEASFPAGVQGNVREDEELQRSTHGEENALEDVPTQMVSTPVEDVPTQVVERPVEDAPTRAMPVSVDKPVQVQEPIVEASPTNPFLSVPPTQKAAQQNVIEDWRVRSKEPVNSSSSSALQPEAAPFISSHGYAPVEIPANGTYTSENAASAFPVRRKRRRWPLIVTLLVLIVLVIGGLGVAMLASQPSSPDPMIQPQVGFANTQLGISLLYPNGWIKQVDTGTSTAHFYASNHVGEVDIIVATASGSAKQALQQQVTKMGMGSKKADASLTFAGTGWQQMQGTMEQGGASYADTVLATIHGSQLYIIVQQAPQSTYADWEKEFFSPLRASLKFV